MATASSPILIYQPEGGVPVGPVSNPPVYSQAGTTQLVEGQAYIDVMFGSIQTTDEWVLVECAVVNEIDADPLNIWPGIITEKAASGFRIYLNGLPDSGNYYLHWAVSGINIAPSPASTYFLSAIGTTFTVSLPPSTTLAAPVIVTPDDGGAGGTFAPTFVTLTTGSPSQTFIYTPAGYGDITITTTNSGPLTNPTGIVLTVATPTYTLTGPSTGVSGVASTNFTVTLIGTAIGTVTVTPSSGGGGGTFTPTSVALTNASPSVTFTYTPASAGAKTISVTNDGGLANPGSLTYTATAPDVFTDNFTGAGPTALSAHTADTGQSWQVFNGAVASDIFVTGNSLGGSSTASADCASGFHPVPDCEATVTVVKGTISGSPEVGIWLRLLLDGSNPQGYVGRFIQGTGWQISRLFAGSLTALTGSLSGTITTGDTLQFTVSGVGATVTLNLYQNGALVATASDTATSRIIASGFVGTHLFDATGGSAGTNYRIDKISSPTASAVPPAIAGLRGWWQADTFGLADAATVGNWADSSGTLHYLSSTGTTVFKINIVNSKPVARFNGSTAGMNTNADSIPGNYTVFAVTSAASISGGDHVIMDAGVGATEGTILRRTAGDMFFYHNATAGYVSVTETGGIVAAAWNVFSANWDGSNIHMWRNGTLKGTTAATGNPNAGTKIGVGYNPLNSNGYWDGDIAEVLVYNVALGTTDRQAVEAYLKAKYNTP